MIALARSKVWNQNFHKELELSLKQKVVLIATSDDLNPEHLKLLGIKKIFFTHWSYIIKPDVYNEFECVIFHMTDLPFGRGGSPLQNLISRGIYQTKISALRCSEGIDNGPVYLKKDLTLEGSAQEIFERANQIIFQMILEIETLKPIPQAQSGEPVIFKRRKPEESNIAGLDSIEKVYDYIRMLDAEGYPNAFLEHNGIRYEFTRAILDNGEIVAQVRIKK